LKVDDPGIMLTALNPMDRAGQSDKRPSEMVRMGFGRISLLWLQARFLEAEPSQKSK